MRRQRGQATLELLAGIPALLLAALVALQLLLTAYSAHVADNAAEAGALALVAGRDAKPAMHAALPGWARERVRASSAGGKVQIAIRPPAPLGSVSRALEVRSTAWARPPDG